jgi:hypothetical protein
MDRRSFLTGLGASLVAAPAIVRAAGLMPVRGIIMPIKEWRVSRYVGNGVTCHIDFGRIPPSLLKRWHPDVLADVRAASLYWGSYGAVPHDALIMEMTRQ